MYDNLQLIREQLFDAPAEIKLAFNSLIQYFSREPEYAFLLLDVRMHEFIRKIQEELPEEDLYKEEGPDSYGLEKESHVTIYPCMPNDIDPRIVMDRLIPLEDIESRIVNVSIFENAEKPYIVLKADVESPQLKFMNEDLSERVISFSEFKDYHPHLTIAYIKKGTETYKKFLKEGLDIKVKPLYYVFSWREDEELKRIKIVK